MHLSIEALGETVMRRDMLRFADHLAIPAPALLAAGDALREVARLQFDSEGAHSGEPWAPLADSTVLGKSRHGLDPHILRATDALFNALTDKSDPDHIEETPSADTLRFGANVGYGEFHQSGTRKMPQRRPIALTEVDKVMLMKAIQRELVAGIRAAGGGAEALARRSSFFRDAIA